MPGAEFHTSDVAANMANQLVDSPKYRAAFDGVNVDRIAFIQALGKKKPASLPTPLKIQALSPLMRAVSGDIVFLVVLYDEWFEWPEGKQFAALLEQLMMIKNDGRTNFEDGKLRKYDVVALRYMVDNFGLDWAVQDEVQNPLETATGTPTFSGTAGVATATQGRAVAQVFGPDDLSDIDESLGDLPNEIES